MFFEFFAQIAKGGTGKHKHPVFPEKQRGQAYTLDKLIVGG
jgi:hypothetical protein